MIPIGLDIGTGYVKISGNGRKRKFPSLYSCMYSDGRGDIEDQKAPARKRSLVESTGMEALAMGSARHGVMIRPVKHGVPHNDAGFAALAREAIRAIGISDPSQAVIAAGVTYDAQDKVPQISRIITRTLSPGGLRIIPQAYGTLMFCRTKRGTVVNIGHGTTEIITIRDGMHEGTSIPKAVSFVTDQLDKGRGSYVDYKSLLARDEAMTARLVRLLAAHIADELSRVGTWSEDGIILAGGGALLPGMRESLEDILGTSITVPDDPVYSNAVGLEMIAAKNSGGGGGGGAAGRSGRTGETAPASAGDSQPPAPE